MNLEDNSYTNDDNPIINMVPATKQEDSEDSNINYPSIKIGKHKIHKDQPIKRTRSKINKNL